MKTIDNSTLGFTFPVSVPATAEEFDQLSGKSGACVEEAVNNVLYRSWNSDFRESFAEELEKSTGIKRRLDEKAMAKAAPRKSGAAAGTVADIFESAGSYFAFVKATEGKESSDYKAIADKVAARIVFDPKPSARTGKPGKELIAAAEGVLAKGPDALARVIANLNSRNGLSLEIIDGTIAIEDLARAIGVEQTRKLAEAMAGLED